MAETLVAVGQKSSEAIHYIGFIFLRLGVIASGVCRGTGFMTVSGFFDDDQFAARFFHIGRHSAQEVFFVVTGEFSLARGCWGGRSLFLRLYRRNLISSGKQPPSWFIPRPSFIQRHRN